jgi:hypothetical protein
MDGALLDRETALAAAHNLDTGTPAGSRVMRGHDCMVAWRQLS